MDQSETVQDYTIAEGVRAPFQYLVNDIIPRSPELAYLYGIIQYYGALDAQIDEYLMINLDSLEVPMAQPTAAMLDYVYRGAGIFGGSEFLASLAEAETIPQPFKDNPVLISSSINSLVASTMMGYYSEWYGYGTTRLAPPNDRVMEYAPFSWSQIGYPGPSLGYRVLRQYEF